MRELVYIVMTTYKRYDIAARTLEGLQKNLLYDPGRLAWHIADDGTGDKYIDRLKACITAGDLVTSTDAGRQGVGVSKNRALKHVFEQTPLVLLLEDDWLLTEQLDLRIYADMLVKHSTYGMVRFGYLSTGITAQFIGIDGQPYWSLERDSNLYVYSGQVSLRHKRFYDVVGYHGEGLAPGEEELDMCRRFNKTKNAPGIVWPGDILPGFNKSAFKNIGLDCSLNSVMPEVR